MGYYGDELLRCVREKGWLKDSRGDDADTLFILPDGGGLAPGDRMDPSFYTDDWSGVHTTTTLECLMDASNRFGLSVPSPEKRDVEVIFMRETGAVRVVPNPLAREAVKPTWRDAFEFQALTEPKLTDAQMRALSDKCRGAEKCFWDINHASGRQCSGASLSDDAETSWRRFTEEYRRCTK